MHVLVAYDINDNARRAKLFKKLKSYLTRVQESVFEGFLPPKQYNSVLRHINATIDHSVDTVRIYSLCKSCAGQTTLLGQSCAVHVPGEPMLF